MAAFLNVLTMVGAGVGTAQPLKLITSKLRPAPVLSFLAPDAAMRNVVVPVVLVSPEKLMVSEVQFVLPGMGKVAAGRFVNPEPLL